MRGGRRRALALMLWPALTVPFSARGAFFSVVDVDRNGTVRETTAEIQEPSRAQAARVEVWPSSEIEASRPTAFYLAGEADALFGPFALDDRVPVKIGGLLFRVSGVGEGSLSLQDERSGQVYGPFAATNATPVALPSTNLTLMRTSSFIRGTLTHKALAVKNVTVALVPMTAPNQKSLSRLASAFLRLTQQYHVDTAAVRYRLPTVRTVTGKVYEPVFEPSDRDIENSRKKADMGAKGAFKAFLDSARVSTAACGSGQRFAFKNLPPADYVVCALADVRSDPDSRAVPPGVVIWWATLAVRQYQATDLKFDQQSARDWQDLFKPAR